MDRDKDVPPERRDKLVKTVISSARSAQRLIDDLLDFTLVRVGRGLAVHRLPCDFHAVVARAVDALALAFPGRILKHVPLGEGDIDWAAVYAALHDVGYEGSATLELDPGDGAYLKEMRRRFGLILSDEMPKKA